jgi:hypothetical protein
VLFNEPKLLKSQLAREALSRACFSALQRAEIAEISSQLERAHDLAMVSVLFNEPKLLKSQPPLPSPPVFQTPTPARRRS